MGIDARGRIIVGHRPVSSNTFDPSDPMPFSISRFDPADSSWTNLALPALNTRWITLHVDAPGNIWVYEVNRYARYDDGTGTWMGPRNVDYAPADASRTMSFPTPPIATDRHGNAWAMGARLKSSNDQDLPVLWINRFDATTLKWGEPASLNVTGGESPLFVASSNSEYWESPSFSASLAMDPGGRPVAVVTESVPTGWIGVWSRSWVTWGPANS